MIIAIDYDDTITEYRPFPETAPIRPEAREIIKKLFDEGHVLILWTARDEPYYSECLDRLKAEGLYDYFRFDYPRTPTGKVAADFYIEDRSQISGDVDWKAIYEHIKAVNLCPAKKIKGE